MNGNSPKPVLDDRWRDAAGGGFTGDKVVEISKKFDTEFPQDSDTCGTAARR